MHVKLYKLWTANETAAAQQQWYDTLKDITQTPQVSYGGVLIVVTEFWNSFLGILGKKERSARVQQTKKIKRRSWSKWCITINSFFKLVRQGPQDFSGKLPNKSILKLPGIFRFPLKPIRAQAVSYHWLTIYDEYHQRSPSFIKYTRYHFIIVVLRSIILL